MSSQLWPTQRNTRSDGPLPKSAEPPLRSHAREVNATDALYPDHMRSAGKLLLIEASALRPVLDALDPSQYDQPTVCTDWSVRDVLAHCGAALTMLVANDLHGFSPAENEADVVERRPWPIEDVLGELFVAYEAAAVAINQAGGSKDGIGLGEWIHGGDVREAVGAENPYTSEGVDLAFDLLLERSAALHLPHGQTSRGTVVDKPVLDIVVDDKSGRFGGEGRPVGSLRTDLETFIRLCGGRRPDADRYDLTGAEAQDLALFS